MYKHIDAVSLEDLDIQNDIHTGPGTPLILTNGLSSVLLAVNTMNGVLDLDLEKRCVNQLMTIDNDDKSASFRGLAHTGEYTWATSDNGNFHVFNKNGINVGNFKEYIGKDWSCDGFSRIVAVDTGREDGQKMLYGATTNSRFAVYEPGDEPSTILGDLSKSLKHHDHPTGPYFINSIAQVDDQIAVLTDHLRDQGYVSFFTLDGLYSGESRIPEHYGDMVSDESNLIISTEKGALIFDTKTKAITETIQTKTKGVSNIGADNEYLLIMTGPWYQKEQQKEIHIFEKL